MEPVLTKLSDNLTVERYPESFTLDANAGDLRWASQLLTILADVAKADCRFTQGGINEIIRLSKVLRDGADRADAEKDADRAEQDRADAEHQIKTDAVEDYKS